MFDIGFPELLLVSVIALVVIGPEKLPETIRTLSLWVGRLKRSLATIRSEIEAEIGADDIKRQLRDESVLQGMKETKVQLEEIIDTTRNDLTAISRSVTSIAHNGDALDPGGSSQDGDAESQAGNTKSQDSQTGSQHNDAGSPDSDSPSSITESDKSNPDPVSHTRMKDDGRGG